MVEMQTDGVPMTKVPKCKTNELQAGIGTQPIGFGQRRKKVKADRETVPAVRLSSRNKTKLTGEALSGCDKRENRQFLADVSYVSQLPGKPASKPTSSRFRRSPILRLLFDNCSRTPVLRRISSRVKHKRCREEIRRRRGAGDEGEGEPDAAKAVCHVIRSAD